MSFFLQSALLTLLIRLKQVPLSFSLTASPRCKTLSFRTYLWCYFAVRNYIGDDIYLFKPTAYYCLTLRTASQWSLSTNIFFFFLSPVWISWTWKGSVCFSSLTPVCMRTLQSSCTETETHIWIEFHISSVAFSHNRTQMTINTSEHRYFREDEVWICIEGHQHALQCGLLYPSKVRMWQYWKIRNISALQW